MNRLVGNQQQEKITTAILVGIPVLALLLLVAWLGSRYVFLQTQKTQNQSLLQAYTWLHTQTQPLLQRHNNLGNNRLGYIGQARELGPVLQEGLPAFALKGKLTAAQGGWQLQLSQGRGDQVLAFIQAAMLAGAQVTNIQLSRQDNLGQVKGHVHFAPLWGEIE
jgi:hypothetical protein